MVGIEWWALDGGHLMEDIEWWALDGGYWMVGI